MASRRAMFGATEEGEPALPGTYGDAPKGFRLPAQTALGAVTLQVADLSRSLDFYQRVLGMKVVIRDASTATLSAQHEDKPLVLLVERPGVAAAGKGGLLGLYHYAILLPDRPSLGRLLRHLGENNVRLGASDHLVSEAIYLHDPDGLGIEIYRDRARSEWRRVGRELVMATDPLDADGLFEAAGTERWSGMPAGTTMGHVHLHVGSILEADAFYSSGLGFDRMVARYPGALFLGAGGYHHHLGTNVWAGAAARTPGENDARLLEWTITVPSSIDVRDAFESLRAGGFSVEMKGGAELRATDPWDTTVRVLLP